MLEKLFQLKAHNTNVRTEILAGITTFLAMAYILFVNPSILGETGMDKGAVFVATCLAAAIGSTVMGLIAIGVTMVIITAGIDLSSGSVLALASVVAASLAQRTDFFAHGKLLLLAGVEIQEAQMQHAAVILHLAYQGAARSKDDLAVDDLALHV